LGEDVEVGGRYARQAANRHQSGRRRRGQAEASGGVTRLNPFKPAEEKEFVFEDRTALVAPEAPEVRTRHELVFLTRDSLTNNAIALLRVIEGVEVKVLKEREGCAVKLVAAALGDGDELAAVRAPEFRRELILEQRELRHVFRRDVNLRPRDGLIIIVHAVHHEVVVARALSAD
jgi:hypothetical protein